MRNLIQNNRPFLDTQYHIENWRKLTSDPWILETVTGCHLEFDSIPKQTGIPKPPPFGGFEKQLIDDEIVTLKSKGACLLYTSPSPRDQRGSRMPSSA